jgi:hypothetical protein
VPLLHVLPVEHPQTNCPVPATDPWQPLRKPPPQVPVQPVQSWKGPGQMLKHAPFTQTWLAVQVAHPVGEQHWQVPLTFTWPVGQQMPLLHV